MLGSLSEDLLPHHRFAARPDRVERESNTPALVEVKRDEGGDKKSHERGEKNGNPQDPPARLPARLRAHRCVSQDGLARASIQTANAARSRVHSKYTLVARATRAALAGPTDAVETVRPFASPLPFSPSLTSLHAQAHRSR